MNAIAIHPKNFTLSTGENGTFEVMLEHHVIFCSQLASECDHFIQVFSRFPEGTWKLLEEIRLWARELQSLHLSSEVLLSLFETLESPCSEVLPETDLTRFYSQEYAVAHFMCDTLQNRSICTPQTEMLTALTAALVRDQLELEEDECSMTVLTGTLRTIVDAVESAAGFTLDPTEPSAQRFLVHLRFLALRILKHSPENHEVDTEWYHEYAERYPDVFQCVNAAALAPELRYDYTLGTDERFYLLIHLVQLFRIHKEAHG